MTVGCIRQPVITAELVPRSLKAVNLEETFSRRDEVMLAYTLISYDAKNKPIGVVNGGWGVESLKKGQLLDLQHPVTEKTKRSVDRAVAKPIQLALPKNGKIVASIVLIEVDDYKEALQTLAKIQKIHNVVAIPMGLLIMATDVLTPLKYVSAGLAASGIGLKLMDKLDTDDVLGQSSVKVLDAAVRKGKQRVIEVPAVFSGQKMRDKFEYQLIYDVLLKTI